MLSIFQILTHYSNEKEKNNGIVLAQYRCADCRFISMVDQCS